MNTFISIMEQCKRSDANLIWDKFSETWIFPLFNDIYEEESLYEKYTIKK